MRYVPSVIVPLRRFFTPLLRVSRRSPGRRETLCLDQALSGAESEGWNTHADPKDRRDPDDDERTSKSRPSRRRLTMDPILSRFGPALGSAQCRG